MTDRESSPKGMFVLRPHPPQEIPGLGTVTFRPVTGGMVHDAEQLAAAEETEPDTAFANSLIAAMIVQPERTLETMTGFACETAVALAEIAAHELGAQKEFTAIGDEIPPRERLHQAYRDHRRASFEQLQSSIERSTIGSLESLYGDAVAEKLRDSLLPDNVQAALSETLHRLATIDLNLAGLDLASSATATWLDDQTRETQGILDAIRNAQAASFPELVEDVTRATIPEPFLSDMLLASGLNSPRIHSPLYHLADIEPMYTKEDVAERAHRAQRRRLLDAYDVLLTLETRLRELIEAKLNEVHGPAWWKRGVPEAVRKGCTDRKQQREGAFGPNHPPIEYAYVDDYRAVILRGDNWATAFEPIFGSKIQVEAMFMWVGPVRTDVAHSRHIAADEYQQFVVAANWLPGAIDRALGPAVT